MAGGGTQKSDLLRVTGLFPTKRKGMYTGTLRPEDSQRLSELLEKTDRVSIFVFRNDRDRDSGAEFVMYAAQDTREQQKSGGQRRVERRPIGRNQDPPEPERDDDLPF